MAPRITNGPETPRRSMRRTGQNYVAVTGARTLPNHPYTYSFHGMNQDRPIVQTDLIQEERIPDTKPQPRVQTYNEYRRDPVDAPAPGARALRTRKPKKRVKREEGADEEDEDGEDDGTIFRVGDAVIVEGDTGESVGVIVTVYIVPPGLNKAYDGDEDEDGSNEEDIDEEEEESEESRMRVRIHWFYRPTQLPKVRASRAHEMNEIYMTTDFQSVVTPAFISRRCIISSQLPVIDSPSNDAQPTRTQNKPVKRKRSNWTYVDDEPDSFYCHLAVDAALGAFYDLDWDPHHARALKQATDKYRKEFDPWAVKKTMGVGKTKAGEERRKPGRKPKPTTLTAPTRSSPRKKAVAIVRDEDDDDEEEEAEKKSPSKRRKTVKIEEYALPESPSKGKEWGKKARADPQTPSQGARRNKVTVEDEIPETDSPSKRGGRLPMKAAVEEDSDAPVPRNPSKGKAKKKDIADDEQPEPKTPSKRGRPKKAVVKEDSDVPQSPSRPRGGPKRGVVAAPESPSKGHGSSAVKPPPASPSKRATTKVTPKVLETPSKSKGKAAPPPDTESGDDFEGEDDEDEDDDVDEDEEGEDDEDEDMVSESESEDDVRRSPRKRNGRSAPSTPRKRRGALTRVQPTPHSKKALLQRKKKKGSKRTIKPPNFFASHLALDEEGLPSDPWFRAMKVLHVGQRPDVLPCRDGEYEKILTEVEQLIEEGSGGCVYISGVPGTGKTATVHAVIRELKRRAENQEINPFSYSEINGLRVPEPAHAYTLLWESVSGHNRDTDGLLQLDPKRALERLTNHFGRGIRLGPAGHACVVLMDEVDQLLTPKQDVIYNFFNWPTMAGSKLIVVAVANTHDLAERVMNARVRSRLGMKRVIFDPYNANQLIEIVNTRLNLANQAFEGKDNKVVLEPDAIRMAAMKVASIAGDARRVLDICRRTVELVQVEERSAKAADVSKVVSAMQNSSTAKYISGCSLHERIMLASLLRCQKRQGIEEIKWGDLEKQHLNCRAALSGNNDSQRVPTVEDLFLVLQNLLAARAIVIETGAVVARKDERERRVLLNIEHAEVLRVLIEEGDAKGGTQWRRFLT